LRRSAYLCSLELLGSPWLESDSEVGLSGLDVPGGVDHIVVQLLVLVEVIDSSLGWVDWGWQPLPDPLVVSDLLGLLERAEVVLDVVVNTEVWHDVVNWVRIWGNWVEVLAASGGRADWVGLGLGEDGITRVAVILVVNGLWDDPVAISILLWVPGTVDSLLSLHMRERVLDILIDTVVWVWSDIFRNDWLWLPLMIKLLLSGIN